jgi:hypothetical protein
MPLFGTRFASSAGSDPSKGDSRSIGVVTVLVGGQHGAVEVDDRFAAGVSHRDQPGAGRGEQIRGRGGGDGHTVRRY